jgi:hypothetical protein
MSLPLKVSAKAAGIPLVNLDRQYAELKSEILRAVESVFRQPAVYSRAACRAV